MIKRRICLIGSIGITIRYGEWPPFVNSTNVVKLPNHRNSIHEELRSTSLSPERKTWLEAQSLAEWADSRASCTEVSNGSVGHSLYRMLPAFVKALVDRCLDSSSVAQGLELLGRRVERSSCEM